MYRVNTWQKKSQNVNIVSNNSYNVGLDHTIQSHSGFSCGGVDISLVLVVISFSFGTILLSEYLQL